MGLEKPKIISFHEILLEKMNDQTHSEKSSTNSVMTTQFIDFTSHITSQSPIYLNLKTHFYPRKSLFFTEKNNAPAKLEPHFSVTKLSVAAQIALGILGLVSQTFSLKQVKSAYRKMARRQHPDLNPNANSESFRQLKEASQIVIQELELLKKNSTF